MVRNGYLGVSAGVVYAELLFSVVVVGVVVGDLELEDGVRVQGDLVVERAVPFSTEARVLEGVRVCVVDASPRYEVVESVGSIWVGAEKGCK
jgi:hypothetical protein